MPFQKLAAVATPDTKCNTSVHAPETLTRPERTPFVARWLSGGCNRSDGQFPCVELKSTSSTLGIRPSLRGYQWRSSEVLVCLVRETRGGTNRGKILSLLLECPRNAHRIAEELKLNYGTVRLHLRRMQEEGLVITITSKRYGLAYAVADEVKGDPQTPSLLATVVS